MKKIIIAVAVALAILVVAAPVALACWTSTSCTQQHTCSGSYTYEDPRCGDGQAGGTKSGVASGYKCLWENGPGSVGCLTQIKLLWNESWCIPGGDDADCCKYRSYATMSGVGCCQAPCPPTIPNCNEN